MKTFDLIVPNWKMGELTGDQEGALVRTVEKAAREWEDSILPARLTCALMEPRLVFHTMRLHPANIQVIGNELAIKWNDGSETFLPLEILRRACPCAGCVGEPDVLGRVARPQGAPAGASFRLKSWQVIGGYALQPAWEDGHHTGLYTFDNLKRLEAGVDAGTNDKARMTKPE